MATSGKLVDAFYLFDEANRQDPNTEDFGGQTYPKELLYAHRMSDTLGTFAPNASEALQLAARCQHICRWEIPRDNYEQNRAGYLKWRQDLKKFHAQKAAELLNRAGYDQDTIENVEFLLLKKQLKKNEETQVLEDVVCLVFLQHYFEAFCSKHPEEKIIDILQKTWRKMSSEGQKAALELPMSKEAVQLIKRAIDNGAE